MMIRHKLVPASALLAVLASPAAFAETDIEGFTCCNLHYEGDWISDANWTTLPFLPAGSRIVVNEFGRQRATVTIDGRRMRIGLDYGREAESKEQFVAKLVVKDDPKARIAMFSPNVQSAVRAGKVMPGMTKEEVIVSLGYPRTDATPSLNQPEWTYWTLAGDRYLVIWGPDERVKEIDSLRAIRHLVVHGN